MDGLPFALVTGVAAAALFLPFALHESAALTMEASAFVAGFIGAGMTWRAARRFGLVTARAGIGVGVVTALVVHLLLSLSLALSTGFDLEMLAVAGLLFTWSVVLLGWLSLPLGALVGWWMMRRSAGSPAAPG
jgi:hypothetical protein